MPFLKTVDLPTTVDLRPRVNAWFCFRGNSHRVEALVDTGATVTILPLSEAALIGADRGGVADAIQGIGGDPIPGRRVAMHVSVKACCCQKQVISVFVPDDPRVSGAIVGWDYLGISGVTIPAGPRPFLLCSCRRPLFS